jgi:hypothetical protein
MYSTILIIENKEIKGPTLMLIVLLFKKVCPVVGLEPDQSLYPEPEPHKNDAVPQHCREHWKQSENTSKSNLQYKSKLIMSCACSVDTKLKSQLLVMLVPFYSKQGNKRTSVHREGKLGEGELLGHCVAFMPGFKINILVFFNNLFKT